MHTTNLRKVGDAVMLAVPPAILDLLGWTSGSKVEVAVQDGRLVVAPRVRPHYRLDELLARCDPTAAQGDEDRSWLEAPITGAELL